LIDGSTLSLPNFLVQAKTMILGKQHNKQGNGPFPYPVLSLIIALGFFAWLTLLRFDPFRAIVTRSSVPKF